MKLKVKDREHLVRTEIQGAANIAFRAVGAKIPERVQITEPSQEKGIIVVRVFLKFPNPCTARVTVF